MRSKKLFFTAALAVVAITAAGCTDGGNGGSPPGANGNGGLEDLEPITMTVSINEPEGVLNDYARDYLDEITAKTDGKITFELFYAGSLLAGDQVVTGVADGVADIGQVTPTAFPNQLPIATWFQGLGFLAVQGWPLGPLAEAGAVFETFRDDPDIQAEYAAQGIVPLFNNSTAPSDMICSSSAETVEETRGLRIRVGGPALARETEQFGMTPEFMPTADVYEALQRGIMDCVYGGGPAFGPLGWIEVAPYYVPVTGASALGIGLVMNKDLWEGLPDEVREIFRDAAPTAIARQQEVFVQVRANLVDQLNELPNGTIQDPSELNAILDTYHTELLNEIAESAPATLTDPEAFLATFEQKLRVWEQETLSPLGLPDTGGLDPDGLLDAPDLVDWNQYTEIIREAIR